MKPIGFYNVSYNKYDYHFRYYCAYCRKMNSVKSNGRGFDLKDMVQINRIMPEVRFFSTNRIGRDSKIKIGQPSEVYDGVNTSAILPEETKCYCHHCKITANAKWDRSIGNPDVPRRNFLKYIHVQEDYKRVYVNVFAHYNTYFKDRLQINEYMIRFVFNFRIGAVTMLAPLDQKGKVPKRFEIDVKSRQNVTYGVPPTFSNTFENSKEVASMFRQHVFPALTKKLKDEFCFIKDNHFESIFTLENTEMPHMERGDGLGYLQVEGKRYFRSFRNIMNDTIHAFRFHSVPPHFLRGISTLMIQSTMHPDERVRMTKMMLAARYRSTNQMNNIFKSANINYPKSVRKSLTSIKDIFNAEKVYGLINRAENLARIIKARDVLTTMSEEGILLYVKLFTSHYVRQIMNENKKISRTKALIKAETLVTKRLAREKNFYNYYIKDTIRNIVRLKKEGVNYSINTDHSLKRIHDDTSSVLDKVRRKNRNIFHDAQFLHLEGEYEGYIFKFPRETHELIDIGRSMNICVGGYDMRAFKKQLNILQVSTKDDPYICCIELSADYESMYQAKLHGNQRPEGKLKQAILKWIAEHEINILTYDISRNGSEPNDFDKGISYVAYPLPLPEEVQEFINSEEDKSLNPFYHDGHNINELENLDYDNLLAI